MDLAELQALVDALKDRVEVLEHRVVVLSKHFHDVRMNSSMIPLPVELEQLIALSLG